MTDVVSQRRRNFISVVVLAGTLGACRPMIYDIDRMEDPAQRARFTCQYLLERALADADQIDADGVLRRRIADFAEPTLTTTSEVAHVAWGNGAIVIREGGSRHEGSCALKRLPRGFWVKSVNLDGRELHAGFGM